MRKALALVIFAFPALCFAQLTLTSVSSALSINANPAAPGPNETVELTAASSYLDLSGATLTWSSGGNTLAQGVGATSVEVQTGALGSATTVNLSVQDVLGQNASASITLRPATVDLLVDSDAYVPPFYRGRALPSPGSDLLVQAQAHFSLGGGKETPDSQISYTWKRDGEVLGSLSGTGKSLLVVPAPVLYGNDLISVDASSLDGTYAASASVRVASVDPGVTLYEDNPLFGLMYHQALGAQSSIPDAEMTFAAVPYFAPVQTPNDQTLRYAWQVNGAPIAANASNASEITINAQHSNGIAAIGLTLTDSSDILLDATGAWNILLGQASGGVSGGASSAGNPFTSGGY